METRKPVVLITGSSGFIGAAVIEKLAGHFDLVGLDRQTPPQPSPQAEFVGIDLTSDASVDAALARVRAAHGDRIASVIHLASYFDLTGEPSSKYEEVTVRGTERLLKALKTFDTEQFVFVSTMLVHAPTQPGQPIDEDSPLDTQPLPYRQSKIQTEQLLRDQHGDIPVVLLRPAGIYDDMGHSAFLAQQIARIFERQMASHVYPGSLESAQPSLHLDDLTDTLLRLVRCRAELPAELPLLLAESEGLSVDEMQRTLARLIHDETWETKEIPKPLAKAGAWVQTDVLDEDRFIRPWMVDIADDHYEVDTSRAKQLLGWTPAHSLRETLPGIIAALKDDPVGWYRVNKLNAARVATLAVDAESERGSAGQAAADEGTGATPAHDEKMQEHMQGMRKMHFDKLWVHYLNIMLGAWLLSSPFVFGSLEASGFSDAVMRVTVDRGLADPAQRSAWLGLSDVASGLLIMLFGALSLSPRFSWAQWANTAVGTWLLFAPLVFWAPSAAVYANDTLVGALVIAFAVLVPMMPGMSMAGMMDRSDLPAGWTYSPSTYLQRLPIIALGLIGLLISRHLAAYQLGHIDTAWEPFFSGRAGLNGTEDIVTSDVSKAWPVADAGLGAVTYVFEVLMSTMGDRRRWRTMPWMVAMFGVAVVPLGVISIYFIIIQPIVIGTWCTLCLVTGVAMLAMIPYSLDELVATGQFMVQDHRRGGRFWHTFFRGGAQPDGGCDETPGFDAPLAKSVKNALSGGATMPWTLIVSALLGVLLMVTRLLFGTEPPMADSDHLVGALIVTFAVMAMSEVGRALRFVNVAFGAWLVIAPWVLDGAGTLASWMGVAIGVAVIGLSLPRGKRSKEHYGSWDRFVV